MRSPVPRIPLVALALCLAVAASACGKARTPAGEQPAPAATGQPASAGTGAPLPAGATRYAIAAGSVARYIAREKFVNRNLPNEAVGETSTIQGELVVGANGAFLPSQVKVDLRTLKSDSPRRDNALRRRWLESDKYPWAEFTVTGVEGAPAQWPEGQPAQFKLVGKLKVRDREQTVTWDATATRSGKTLQLEATTAVKMSDFGITPPDIAGLLKAEDNLKLQVKLVAQQQ